MRVAQLPKPTRVVRRLVRRGSKTGRFLGQLRDAQELGRGHCRFHGCTAKFAGTPVSGRGASANTILGSNTLTSASAGARTVKYSGKGGRGRFDQGRYPSGTKRNVEATRMLWVPPPFLRRCRRQRSVGEIHPHRPGLHDGRLEQGVSG